MHWRLIDGLAAACAIVAAQVSVRVASGSAVRWASSRPSRDESSEGTLVRSAQFARAVAGVAARLPWPASCLEQGIALVLLLWIARRPARLVVGVSREESSLRAHAWVESDGRVILGAANEPEFAPLPLSRTCP